MPADVRGVVVAQVGSEIGGGQLRAGDVIEAINQEPVTSVEDYATGDSVARSESAAGALGLPATQPIIRGGEAALIFPVAAAIHSEGAQAKFVLSSRNARGGGDFRINE